MVINGGERQYLATSEDSVFLFFENDLLDGFYHQMDEEFLYISKHSPSYSWIAEAALEEGGFPSIEMKNTDYTLEDPQLEMIIQGLGKFIIFAFEKELREAL